MRAKERELRLETSSLLSLALVIISCGFVSAHAATSPGTRDFLKACGVAFGRAVADAPEGWADSICHCALKDAHDQGVTDSVLKSEASQIQADPKHEIRDQKLLDALHACAIDSVHDHHD